MLTERQMRTMARRADLDGSCKIPRYSLNPVMTVGTQIEESAAASMNVCQRREMRRTRAADARVGAHQTDPDGLQGSMRMNSQAGWVSG